MQLPKYENKPFKPPRRLTSPPKAESPPPKKAKREHAPSVKPDGIRSERRCDRSVETCTRNFQGSRCFTMNFRKPSQKKHKTWSGDGYALLREQGKYMFYSDVGKFMGASSYVGNFELIFDHLFRAGSVEIQLDYEIVDSAQHEQVVRLLSVGRQAVKSNATNEILEEPVSSESGPLAIRYQPPIERKHISKFKPVAKASPARTPLTSQVNSTKDIVQPNISSPYRPVFDVTKIDMPIIMNKGPEADVDVIVDPFISKNLRPHQREGVKFMYDCILGLSRPKDEAQGKKHDLTTRSLMLEQDEDVKGCLLADEMGLGKTLTTIALIWTLLKQTPRASQVSRSQLGVPLHGLCSKVLVVCPVTLIANWKREFAKWLNLSRIGILTLSSQNTTERDKYEVRAFLRVQRTYQVLIIGYEKLLSVSEELEKGKSALNLLVCDEGHRLKNGASKILNVLKSLEIQKKILLSGTPIQNDLNEFYTVIDFLNPGILGTYQQFKKNFIIPISKARDPANRFDDCVVSKGEERSQEMIEITRKFVLRRTNSILTAYLPPRMDIILFCRPTLPQISLFKEIFLGSNLNVQSMSPNSSLALITMLKKVCNSPSLIHSDPYFNATPEISTLPEKYKSSLSSGKLKVLMTLLERIKNRTDGEKVVIVSNYTQTLDIIQNLMTSAGMKICRLDGSTPSKQRDGIVTSFNRDPSIFAFLLSAKSGGVGLNLIGASRLILFDNDWNPSVDLQAMSRIHRDGQKNACYVYRLVTTGCIDEKILQRQLMKQSLSQKFLSDSIQEKGQSDDDLFSRDDLRDLFNIIIDTSSNTHDLICSCDGTGQEVSLDEMEQRPSPKESVAVKGALGCWTSALNVQKLITDNDHNSQKVKSNIIKQCLIGYKHIDPTKVSDLLDVVATETAERLKQDITFAFIKPA